MKVSSLRLTKYSFGSSITLTGSSSVLELLETIGNSGLKLLSSGESSSLSGSSERGVSGWFFSFWPLSPEKYTLF